MAHIIETKVIFEIDDDKTFEPYLEEWVNNNCCARYRIIDEECLNDYWTEEKKQNIEDILKKVRETDSYTVYENEHGIVFMTDKENKVRFVYDTDEDKVLYVRSVKVEDILQWIETCRGMRNGKRR